MTLPEPATITYRTTDADGTPRADSDLAESFEAFLGDAISGGALALVVGRRADGRLIRMSSRSRTIPLIDAYASPFTCAGLPYVRAFERTGLGRDDAFHVAEDEVWAVRDPDVLAEMGHGSLVGSPPADEVRLAGGPRDGETVRFGDHGRHDRIVMCDLGRTGDVDDGWRGPPRQTEYVRTGRRDARGREIYSAG